VETRKLRAFSAYWSAHEIGQQPNPAGQSLKMYRPDLLKSAGLTNNPNLPVHLLNEKPKTTSPLTHPQLQPTPLVNKQLILDFLATQGITLANEATDPQISAALEQLSDRVIAAETT